MMNARWSFLAVPLLAAMGCSDPVPLPAQGAISLSVQKPSKPTAGTTCPLPGTTYQIGAPNPPSTINPGDSVIDGDKGAEVNCSVHGSGPFTFSGTLHGSTNDVNKYPITVTFSDGNVGADKTTGTVSVSVFTPQLAGTFSSAPSACTVNVIGKQIKGGSIWATVSCAAVSASPAQECEIGTSSVIVFENCDGS